MNTARIGTSQRELEQLKAFAAQQREGRRPLHRRSALSRHAVARSRSSSWRSRSPTCASSTSCAAAAAGRGGVDAQDQGHRDPADADRADDAGRGPLAQLRARRRRRRRRFTAALAPRYCNFRKTTIYAGSNEIQRNIIAKQALGL
jgi:alkylation response protein AidB-like acyl-CoA dehydrogenase